MRVTRLADDPLTPHVRKLHFVEIFFRGRRLDAPFVTEVAVGDYSDLRELIHEAALANELDEVKALYRYMARVYEYKNHPRRGPVRGPRIVDYVPRGEEGGGHGH